MAQSHAILIGIEEVSGFARWPHTITELGHLADTLALAGVPKTHQTVLMGAAATKSAVESRLRKLLKTLAAGDDLWFAWGGPSFIVDGETFLATSDTLEDDRDATAIRLADLVQAIDQTGAQTRWLTDLPEFGTDDGLTDADHMVGLRSHATGEISHTANNRRVWLHALGETLRGKTPPVAGPHITAAELNDWLTDELPRAIRKAITEPGPQTPVLIGRDNIPFPVAVPEAPKPPKAKLSLKQLKRLVFRGERPAKIRELSGYQKNYRLPEANTPSAQKWLHRLAMPELQADLDEKFNAIREELGYKRKDLECVLGPDGFGFIRTPAFDYAVSVTIDSLEPTTMLWRRELSQFAKADLLQKPAFRKVFPDALETLEFHFDTLIDIEELVDRIEDNRPEGVKIRVGSDASYCEVTVTGFLGKVRVEKSLLRIDGPSGLGPASLVEQFFAFQAQFGGKKGLPAIK
ncbi:hypothetical protein [Zavarzinella formosa]|uniref:hypothetical protein n=1 Tax=Zavarzinella formosa TaxID=360055 RepID=UPI000593A6E8|nr:hypothetical protein [Zavarzinella formosa]